MKHRQHTLQSIIIEVVIVLLASIISFPLSDIVGVSLSALPLVIVVCYVILKSIYHLCISLSAYTIELTSSFIPNNRTRMNVPLKEFLQEQVIMKSWRKEWSYSIMNFNMSNSNTVSKKERRWWKLDAIMKYTLTTFKRLNFGETDFPNLRMR